MMRVLWEGLPVSSSNDQKTMTQQFPAKRNENMYLHRNLHMFIVLLYFTVFFQQVDKTQTSTEEWINQNKQDVVYLYNGGSPSHKEMKF